MKRTTRTAVDAILGDIASEPVATQERPRKRRADYQGPRDWQEVARRHGQPTTYRLPPELRDAIRQRAEAAGIPLSAFVARLLAHALNELDKGNLRGDGKE